MPSGFTLDYIIWVFLVVLGVAQAACAAGQLRGVLFFRNASTRTNVIAGLGLAAAVTVWYFLDERRNLPDTGAGLDANVQARWFVIAGGFAVALTFAVTSAINHRWGANHGWRLDSGAPPPQGLGWLSQTTFYRAIRARIAYWRSRRHKGASV
jgi:hypothetical protein